MSFNWIHSRQGRTFTLFLRQLCDQSWFPVSVLDRVRASSLSLQKMIVSFIRQTLIVIWIHSRRGNCILCVSSTTNKLPRLINDQSRLLESTKADSVGSIVVGGILSLRKGYPIVHGTLRVFLCSCFCSIALGWFGPSMNTSHCSITLSVAETAVYICFSSSFLHLFVVAIAIPSSSFVHCIQLFPSNVS